MAKLPVVAQPLEGFGRRAERDRGEPPETLPFVLRSAIHLKISQGRFRQPWSRRLVMLKWVIDGRARMRVGGRELPIRPGDVAVYIPTVPHAFWVETPHAEMCWFSIDGPLSEQFAYLIGMRPGVYPYGPAPLSRINAMIDSLKDQSLAGRQYSSLLAIQSLYDAMHCLPLPQVSSILRDVRKRIHEALADPELSAGGIAKQLNYNRSSLSRMFHEHTGMTIMEFITQTRLDEAKLLLSQTSDRVSDIARKCGFRDVAYFSRWMRKHSGRPPSAYRLLHLDDREVPERAPALVESYAG